LGRARLYVMPRERVMTESFAEKRARE
jgi:hypothetical protein